jgi:hypothetical protein
MKKLLHIFILLSCVSCVKDLVKENKTEKHETGLNFEQTKETIIAALKTGHAEPSAISQALSSYDKSQPINTMFSQAELLSLYNINNASAFRVLMRAGIAFDPRDIYYRKYIIAIKQPSNPGTWDFSLSEEIKLYVINNWNKLIYYKKNNDLIYKDSSSLNRVFILKNTHNFSKLQNAIVKLFNPDDSWDDEPSIEEFPRKKALEKAQAFAQNSRYFIAPQFYYVNKNNKQFIFEELLALNGNFEFQESLYAYLFEKAEKDSQLENALKTMFNELSDFAIKNRFNDIKFNNIPLSDYGKIALIDSEDAGFSISIVERFLYQNRFFWAPDIFHQEIAAQFVKEKVNFDKNKSKEGLEYATSRLDFLKKNSQCQAKKGVILGDEKINIDQNIINNIFSEEKERKMAAAFIQTINNIIDERKNSGFGVMQRFIRTYYGSNYFLNLLEKNSSLISIGNGSYNDRHLYAYKNNLSLSFFVAQKLLNNNILCSFEKDSSENNIVNLTNIIGFYF